MFKYEYLLKQLNINGVIRNTSLQNIFDIPSYDHLGFYFRYHNKDENERQEIAKITIDPATEAREITEIYRLVEGHPDVRRNIETMTNIPFTDQFIYQSHTVVTELTGPRQDVKVRHLEPDIDGIYFDIPHSILTADVMRWATVDAEWKAIPGYNLILRFNGEGVLIGVYHHIEGLIEDVVNHIKIAPPILDEYLDKPKLLTALNVLVKQASHSMSHLEPHSIALGFQQKLVNGDAWQPIHKCIVELI